MIKQYYRDNFDGTYSVDPDAGLAGIEFTRNGKTFVTIATAWNLFDPASERGELVFKRFLVDEDGMYLKQTITKTIDNSKYMYGNIAQPTFGQYEDQPYVLQTVPVLDEEGNPTEETQQIVTSDLKPNLISEVRFFIYGIIQARWPISLGIGQFQFATIMRIEEITEQDN